MQITRKKRWGKWEGGRGFQEKKMSEYEEKKSAGEIEIIEISFHFQNFGFFFFAALTTRVALGKN